MLAEAIDRPANAAARLISARLFNPVPVIASISNAFQSGVFLIAHKSGKGESAQQKSFAKASQCFLLKRDFTAQNSQCPECHALALPLALHTGFTWSSHSDVGLRPGSNGPLRLFE
jgi:hypothetical protein